MLVMGLVFVDVFLLLVAIAVLLIVVAVVLSMYLDVPFVPTPYRAVPIVIRALLLSPGDVVYELGSGDGRLLLAAARAQPEAAFLGIERNIFLHWSALARRFLAGSPANVSFKRGNFLTLDLSPANKFYLYLLPHILEKLRPGFAARSGARIVSRAFPFTGEDAREVIELSKKPGNHGQHLLYVYEF